MRTTRAAETVMGTINGASGTFTCAAGACSVAFAGEGAVDGTVQSLTGDWDFTSTGYVESEATPDLDHLYFGFWLQESGDAGEGEYEAMFRTVSGGGMPFTGAVTTLEGKATYNGAAAGKYVGEGTRAEGREGGDRQCIRRQVHG